MKWKTKLHFLRLGRAFNNEAKDFICLFFLHTKEIVCIVHMGKNSNLVKKKHWPDSMESSLENCMLPQPNAHVDETPEKYQLSDALGLGGIEPTKVYRFVGTLSSPSSSNFSAVCCNAASWERHAVLAKIRYRSESHNVWLSSKFFIFCFLTIEILIDLEWGGGREEEKLFQLFGLWTLLVGSRAR